MTRLPACALTWAPTRLSGRGRRRTRRASQIPDDGAEVGTRYLAAWVATNEFSTWMRAVTILILDYCLLQARQWFQLSRSLSSYDPDRLSRLRRCAARARARWRGFVLSDCTVPTIPARARTRGSAPLCRRKRSPSLRCPCVLPDLPSR